MPLPLERITDFPFYPTSQDKRFCSIKGLGSDCNSSIVLVKGKDEHGGSIFGEVSEILEKQELNPFNPIISRVLSNMIRFYELRGLYDPNFPSPEPTSSFKIPGNIEKIRKELWTLTVKRGRKIPVEISRFESDFALQLASYGMPDLATIFSESPAPISDLQPIT